MIFSKHSPPVLDKNLKRNRLLNQNAMLQRHLDDSSVVSERDVAFTDTDFNTISKLIYEQAGIVLKPEKKTMVYSRLTKRVRELKFQSFESYLHYAFQANQNEEMEVLINALTTNLTKFFREDHHFQHVKNILMPHLLNSGKRKLRIWSSACSSGEEPYSLAMTILDANPLVGFDAKILATDIDTKMVAHAAAGQYQKVQGIPTPYMQKFTTQTSDNQLQMKPILQHLITFKQLNLLGEWPMHGPFDAVFCRNVVIYFDKDTQQVLFDRIAKLVKPGGFLYIGHSESLHKLSTQFELIGQTIYRRV